ncbi:hypothetical protein ACFL2C_00810 [Patescibacteria group bacterium]
MNKTTLSLIVIFVFGYLLRVMFLRENALLFMYDQARDIVHAQEIVAGDLKVLGPPSSTSGLHHGVLWFYYLVPPSLIGGGNPVTLAYWNAIFNTLTVFTVFMLAYLFTKNKNAGLLAGFLYAISFEATQYATWLSNPTIGAFTIPFVYLGLWIWISNTFKRKYLPPLITGLALGISIQANIFLLFHIVPVIIWFGISRARLKMKHFAMFVIGGFVGVLPMILSEIMFGFRSVGGVVSLLTSRGVDASINRFGDLLVLYLNQIGDVYANNSLPSNIGYGAAFVIILIALSLTSWYRGVWGFRKGTKKIVSWEPFFGNMVICKYYGGFVWRSKYTVPSCWNRASREYFNCDIYL